MRRAGFLTLLFLTLAPLFCPLHLHAAVEEGAKQEKSVKKGGKKAKPPIKTAGRKTGKTVYAAPAQKKQGVPKEQKPSGSAAVAPEAKPAAPANAVVTEVRYWTNPDYTRVSITLDKEAKFEEHQIPGPPGKGPSRIYFDISGASIGRGVKDVPVGDGLLKMVRVGQFKADVVRVVLDADRITSYKAFSFSEPFRLIIDVKGERQPELAALPAEIKAPPPVAEPPLPPKEEKKPRPQTP
ncbi:MAG TPA: AMIN domain-containing protein, partial [Verrucomicrobiae bacterium]|nr:AMIN domain-containing protein [Verrucomicrobiae bacterium]